MDLDLKVVGVLKQATYSCIAVLFRFPLFRRLYVRLMSDAKYFSRPGWDTGTPPKELIELVENGALKPCRSIDLGCGRGHTVRYLQQRGFDAWGIDVSSLAIRQATDISSSMDLPSNFVRADVLYFIPKKKFSLALDVGFYHTLTGDERRFMAEHGYRRFMSEGGRLLLWCKNEDNTDPFTHISEKELRSFFSSDWLVIELRKTSLLHPEQDYYFMHATALAK